MSPRFLIAVWVAVAAAGCVAPPEAREERALQEHSIRFLGGEVTEASDAVAAALGQMDSDPAATRDALERAAAALDRLDSFYLPLLDLRERTEVALQALEGGSVEGCQAELGEMTEIVRGLVEGSTPPLRTDLEALGEELAAARLHLAGEPERVPDLLVALHRRIQDQLLKGHLVLAGGGPED